MKRRLVRSSFEQGAFFLSQTGGEKMRLSSGTPPARPPRPESGDRNDGPADVDDLLARIEAVVAVGDEALVGAEVIALSLPQDIRPDLDLAA